MNATIDANLNAKAIENMIPPKKPDIALLNCFYLNVTGNGLLTGVIDALPEVI